MASAAFAQASDSKSASASVNLIAPLVLTKNGDLDFGTVTTGTGTVTVAASATGTRTDSGGTAAPVASSAHTAASFTLTGENGQAISWTTLPSTVSITGMATAADLSYSWGATAPSSLPSASYDFYVGGTLHVSAADAVGSHSGNFTIAVAYN